MSGRHPPQLPNRSALSSAGDACAVMAHPNASAIPNAVHVRVICEARAFMCDPPAARTPSANRAERAMPAGHDHDVLLSGLLGHVAHWRRLTARGQAVLPELL